MDTVRLFLLHMLDVIHLIVTVLSDHHPLSESVTLQLGRSGLSTCFCGVVAQRWHGGDAVWGFGRRTVGGARDGD